MALTAKTNGASFRAAMESRAANLKIGLQHRIVLYAMTLQQELVASTPILTGKAKAEWQIGLNEEPTGELLAQTRPPTEVDYGLYQQAAIAKLDGYSSGQTIYITNNAPYINALNAGSSRQAAANFVQAAQTTALIALRSTVRGS